MHKDNGYDNVLHQSFFDVIVLHPTPANPSPRLVCSTIIIKIQSEPSIAFDLLSGISPTHDKTRPSSHLVVLH